MPQNIIVGIERERVEGDKGVWTGRVRGLRGHESRNILHFAFHSTPEISSLTM
jgi:hypothetical protein